MLVPPLGAEVCGASRDLCSSTEAYSMSIQARCMGLAARGNLLYTHEQQHRMLHACKLGLFCRLWRLQ